MLALAVGSAKECSGAGAGRVSARRGCHVASARCDCCGSHANDRMPVVLCGCRARNAQPFDLGVNFSQSAYPLPLAPPLMTRARWVFVHLVVATVVSIPRSLPDFAVWMRIPN